MDNKLLVPNEAVPYILYQRTNYLRFDQNVIYKSLHRIFPNPAYRSLIRLESGLFADQVKARYAESMDYEYKNIQDFLPKTCKVVLDIGCGVAGVDPFLAWHYPEPVVFYLLDKSMTDTKVLYEYRPRASFYNSLLVAKALLIMNGIGEEQIKLLEANEAYAIQTDRKVDLVISLLAWGFHFPVETYLDQVCAILSGQGVVIMDLFREGDGLGRMKERFAHVEIIRERSNQIRIAASKKNRVVCPRSAWLSSCGSEPTRFGA